MVAVPVQIIIAIIPIVGIVMGSTLIFFYLLWRHKQIIRQIEKNTYTPVSINIYAFCLLLGILLTIIGTILTILFYFIDGITFTLLGGLLPCGVGISLLLFYGMSRRLHTKSTPPEQHSCTGQHE